MVETDEKRSEQGDGESMGRLTVRVYANDVLVCETDDESVVCAVMNHIVSTKGKRDNGNMVAPSSAIEPTVSATEGEMGHAGEGSDKPLNVRESVTVS
jgi:hypothetical protein